MIYIFGGEQPDTGDVSDLAIGYQEGQWEKFPAVPDSGRDLFGTALHRNLIALVGGLRVNSEEALKILCFDTDTHTWLPVHVQIA